MLPKAARKAKVFKPALLAWNGSGMQRQAFFGGAASELIQVVSGAEPVLTLEDLKAGLLAEVQPEIDCEGLDGYCGQAIRLIRCWAVGK
jgi:hypothetical protein